jgi:hypothetical protein
MLIGDPDILVVPVKYIGRFKSEFDACIVNDISPVIDELSRTTEHRLSH